MKENELKVKLTTTIRGFSGFLFLEGAEVIAHQHEDVICLTDPDEKICFPIADDEWEVPDYEPTI